MFYNLYLNLNNFTLKLTAYFFMDFLYFARHLPICTIWGLACFCKSRRRKITEIVRCYLYLVRFIHFRPFKWDAKGLFNGYFLKLSVRRKHLFITVFPTKLSPLPFQVLLVCQLLILLMIAQQEKLSPD